MSIKRNAMLHQQIKMSTVIVIKVNVLSTITAQVDLNKQGAILDDNS